MDLKEIEKFFKLCRKQGVSEVNVEGISVKFGDLPIPRKEQLEDEDTFDGLTDEELMFHHIHGGK